MNFKIGAAIVCLIAVTQAHATAYYTPPDTEAIIGHVQYRSAGGENVAIIAQKYDLGYNEIENANPQTNLSKLSSRTTLQLPTQHLLPNEARKGIIINLPEMRMYYYPEGTNRVLTFPIGIGKVGKTIPITRTATTTKKINPTWTPPDDIREFNLEQGIVLPKVMPPGPDNPLGPLAIYMKVPTYLIHSTIFPESVGKRASFGCIRMYLSDIQGFFPLITSGIPVAIINAPVKTGWQKNRLYMEAHTPLEEHENTKLPGMVHLISKASQDYPTLVDWQAVAYLAEERDGIPHEVGMRIQ